MEDNPSPSSVPLISATLNSQAALGIGWGLKHGRGLVGVCVSATVPFLIGLGGGVKMALVVIQLLFITFANLTEGKKRQIERERERERERRQQQSQEGPASQPRCWWQGCLAGVGMRG
jgi:hypothetical protein